MGQIVNRRRVFGGGGIDYSKQYLTITALEEGFVGFNIFDNNAEHGISTNYVTSVSYSIDGGSTWTTRQNTGDVLAIDAYLYEGQQVLFKGIANSYYDGTAWGRFQLDTPCSVSGNIMSLLYGDNFIGQTILPNSTYIFYSTFRNCARLVDISNLVMPATTLRQGCYERMFQDCIGLTEIPSGLLPATTLATHCYGCMFYGCTSITSIPSTLLPATTMADYCYEYMFRGTGITTLPEGFLPATTLAVGCYQYMFLSSSVASVPSNLLPATTLANSCYRAMFSTCASLTAAPDLPAGKLVAYCYRSMFYQCSSIKYMKCLATSGLGTTECTQAWLTGNPGGGTFYAKSGVSWASGNSGIPSNWTRVNV